MVMALWSGAGRGCSFMINDTTSTPAAGSNRILGHCSVVVLTSLFLHLAFVDGSANSSLKALIDLVPDHGESVSDVKLQGQSSNKEHFNNHNVNSDVFSDLISGVSEVPSLRNVAVHPKPKMYNKPAESTGNEEEQSRNVLQQFIREEKDEENKKGNKRSKRSLNSINGTTTATPETGSFVAPSSNSKLTELESRIRQVQVEINKLKDDSTISNEVKLRLLGLETSVGKLATALDNHSRHTNQTVSSFDEQMSSLMGNLNKVTEELKEIKADQERERNERALPHDCIDAINSHDFATALKKLEGITDDRKINLIVKKVYDHEAANLDLVLEFGDSIKEVRRRLLVYTALSFEMKSNEHLYPVKIIKLLRSIKSLGNVLTSDVEGVEAEGITSAQVVTLRSYIRQMLTETLKSGMLNKHYSNNTELMVISDMVLSIQETLFSSALTETVAEVYGQLDTREILSSIASHKKSEQVIPGLIAVNDEIKNHGGLSNNKATMKLAFYIRQYLNLDLNPDVNVFRRGVLEHMKSSLPETVKLLIFSTRNVCIRNTHYNEYLYAAGTPNSPETELTFFDSGRRRVFTWVPGGRVYQGSWSFRYTSETDCFYIRNVVHDEYLCTYRSYNPDRDPKVKKVVYAGVKSVKGWERCCWGVELVADNVRMSVDNVALDHLLADDSKEGEDRRNVANFGQLLSGSAWSVEEC